MKVEITKPQLIAIMDAADTLSGMLGVPDEDFNREGAKQIALIDRFLKKNGYKRIYT